MPHPGSHHLGKGKRFAVIRLGRCDFSFQPSCGLRCNRHQYGARNPWRDVLDLSPYQARRGQVHDKLGYGCSGIAHRAVLAKSPLYRPASPAEAPERPVPVEAVRTPVASGPVQKASLRSFAAAPRWRGTCPLRRSSTHVRTERRLFPSCDRIAPRPLTPIGVPSTVRRRSRGGGY